MVKKIKELGIWLNAEFVGVWGRNKGEETFSYHESWLKNTHSRVLSLSLPFTPGNQRFSGDAVKFYFDNLLPDSRNIRDRIAQKFLASSVLPFDLLFEVGRDCVGAIQVLPMGESPKSIKSIRYQQLDDAQVAEILKNTVSSNALGMATESDDLRLSLAGAQEKTALLWHNNKWCRPLGATPTTHIFKLPLGVVGNMQLDMRLSVENEWLCSKIMSAFGIEVADCDMASFQDIKVLIVKRFDRQLSPDGDWIIRLPQEDFCQAKGISPLLKYQVDGGLGLSDCLRVLDGSENAQADKITLFKAQIVFYLLCATDGHAKNFSLFHTANNTYKLTPLYDILSAFPVIGTKQNQISFHKVKLAMSVDSNNRHYCIKNMQKRHFINHATKVGFSKNEAIAMVDEIIQKTENVIKHVKTLLPKDFPSSVSHSIFNGMMRQSQKFK